MRCRTLLAFALFLCSMFSAADAAPPSDREVLVAAKRILFLGDSNTYAGGYVTAFESWLTAKHPGTRTVINVGLPSETVSGLSEDGHAGGAFPRPDVHERLTRVLDLVRPDLVFACYGMNCGIYQPFDEGRFKKYQAGVERLKAEVERRGATLILITPPCYDVRRVGEAYRQAEYNALLGRYADWLLSRKADGWRVISLHAPMTAALNERVAADPEFTFQPDGVHPNDAGHWLMASLLIKHFGDAESAAAASPEAMLQQLKQPPAIYGLIQQRMAVRRDSYLQTAGHLRPGMAQGKSVEEAERLADELTKQIAALK